MRLTIILFLISISASGQLVNRLQKDEKRESFIHAFEKKTVVKMMKGKYKIEDINYFFINYKKSTKDDPYTEYKWASVNGFLVGKDSINLSDIKVKNLATGKVATLRYVETLDYNIEFLKRKAK